MAETNRSKRSVSSRSAISPLRGRVAPAVAREEVVAGPPAVDVTDIEARLLSADYVCTELLSRIAHDLRSPVGVTSGALDEIESSCTGVLGEENRLLIGMARRGLLRLARLADRLAMTAQLERGSLELSRTRVDASKVVQQAIDESLMLHARSNVKVQIDLLPGPRMLVADERWLCVAVGEIVSNAIRHARRHVRVRLAADHPGFYLIVEDDGGGVAPDAKEIFFKRLVPREHGRGLGLGLSVAHDVVVAHGGRLWLDTAEARADPPGGAVTRFIVEIAPAA